MGKSSIKLKNNSRLSNIKKNKKSLRELIINIIHKNSKKTQQPFISRIRLSNEIQKNYNSMRLNSIKFFLRTTLIKLSEEVVLIKKRNSYRFSKLYLNKKAKLLKKKKSKKITSSKSKPKLTNLANLNTKNPNKNIILSTNNKSKKIKVSTKEKKKLKQDINDIKTKLNKKLSLNKIDNKGENTNDNSNSFISNFDKPTIIHLKSSTIIKSNKNEYKRIHPARWQYYDNTKFTNNPSPDGWYEYDPEASDIVEDAWQRYTVHRGLNDVRSIKSGEWEYMVNFMNWDQQNIIHSSHTKRKIRRIDEIGNVTKNPYA